MDKDDAIQLHVLLFDLGKRRAAVIRVYDMQVRSLQIVVAEDQPLLVLFPYRHHFGHMRSLLS